MHICYKILWFSTKNVSERKTRYFTYPSHLEVKDVHKEEDMMSVLGG